MTDRPTTTSATTAAAFDLRLERVLGAYAETAIRPVDAIQIAEHAVLLDRRREARRPLAWLAAAAVVSLLVILLAAALTGGARKLLDGLGLVPNTTSTEAPSSFATAPIERPDAVASALVGRWMGAPRSIGTLEPSAGTTIVVSTGGVCVTGRSYSQGCTVLSSTAVATGSDVIQLSTATGAVGCEPGTVGTYRWRLSRGGHRLIVEAIADECAARAAGLAGNWTRSDCTNTSNDCLGVLEPGAYMSQFLHPRGPAGTYPPSDFGAVGYTVPDGWANSGDWPMLLSLTPAADYANEGPDGASVGAYHELDLLAHPQAAAQNGACDGSLAAGFEAPTRTTFPDWLAAQPAFRVVNLRRTTLAGISAYEMDVRLAAGYSGRCPGEAEVSADYIVLRDDTGRGFTPRLRGAEVHRLILADLGAGEYFAVVIDSSDPARFDTLVAASMPIVRSLVIR